MKKNISTINVSKIERFFQISSEFKLNEGIALSFKFALLFWTDHTFYMRAGKFRQPYCFYCSRMTLISMEERIFTQLARNFMSMEERIFP